MKESIGNTMVFTWVIIFLFLIMLLIMGSLMYSRSFKNRNEIITIIEKYRGPTRQALDDIDAFLRTVGYRQHTGGVVDRSFERHCRSASLDGWSRVNTDNSPFLYCIYRNDRIDLYRVVIFLHLDVPIIGDYVSFPVRGETRVFVDWTSFLILE